MLYCQGELATELNSVRASTKEEVERVSAGMQNHLTGLTQVNIFKMYSRIVAPHDIDRERINDVGGNYVKQFCHLCIVVLHLYI